MRLRPSTKETHGIKDPPTSERPHKPPSQHISADVKFEEEIYQLLQQFIKNDDKAIDYYEKKLIGYEHMLEFKQTNAENILMLLKELY
ncbi:hypothetical protein [Bacillus sp. AG4(2022)]|uniref:hypothetical protein n=1 Tax=Bacillus sp. AG4(2022) TaxID=2962594 RepID=UPI002881DA18|nr:hypothetical protein [Bacillus sp. AG4(2022)]MDT0160410.1 hypothetical protein [Bacillus sp. AG4(2022)]